MERGRGGEREVERGNLGGEGRGREGEGGEREGNREGERERREEATRHCHKEHGIMRAELFWT